MSNPTPDNTKARELAKLLRLLERGARFNAVPVVAEAAAYLEALPTLPQSIEQSEAMIEAVEAAIAGEASNEARARAAIRAMCSAQGECDNGASPSGRATRASTAPQEGLGHSAGIPDAGRT